VAAEPNWGVTVILPSWGILGWISKEQLIQNPKYCFNLHIVQTLITQLVQTNVPGNFIPSS